jgi:hypothetical protein
MTLDRWIQNNTKHSEKASNTTNTFYKLPVGASAIYFKHGEGFNYHYDCGPNFFLSHKVEILGQNYLYTGDLSVQPIIGWLDG